MDKPASLYDARFFEKQWAGSDQSAAATVPVILDLFPDVQSVVDVGCGVGAWLRRFHESGVKVIKGFDGGDPDSAQMLIPLEDFKVVDLTNPPSVSQRFDLAICLEVAEHLPPDSAGVLVRFLTQLADRIVFSAAPPGQPGKGHINVQLPSYWRALFAEHDYEMFDLLRPVIWKDERIASWYRQNTVAFIKRGMASGLRPVSDGDLIDIIHPEILLKKQKLKAESKKPLNRLKRALGW